MKKIVVAIAVVFISTKALATYNANYAGEIEGVYTYADTDSIYIRLKNQPTSHPGCNPTYFVIDAAGVPLERRKLMFSRLMVAYASSEAVNIGYDNIGSCADGYIRVHRVG
jgi:hypothetical protein